MENKKSHLMSDNSSNPLMKDLLKLYRGAGFSEDHTALFTEKAISVLNDYSDLLGEGTEIEYRIFKNIMGITVQVHIPGQEYNPFISGKNTRKRIFDNLLGLNLNTDTVRLTYKYAFGHNIISVTIPFSERKKKLLRDPMILSVILGSVCGLVCLRLPEATNSFQVR